MSAKIDAERTVREQAMNLPPAQMRILLGYLAGYNRTAVESGLEFLASLGVTDRPQAEEPTAAAGPASEPAAHDDMKSSSQQASAGQPPRRLVPVPADAREGWPLRPRANTGRPPSHVSDYQGEVPAPVPGGVAADAAIVRAARLIGQKVAVFDDDQPCPLVGTVVATTADPEFVMVRWDDLGQPTAMPLDELRPAREQPAATVGGVL
jgi:hypothetical protein